MDKIILYIKRILLYLVYSMLYAVESIYRYFQNLKEEQKRMKDRPITAVEYFNVLVDFLLDNSNEFSGINFRNRLEKLYKDAVDIQNEQNRINNKPIYVPITDFLIELQYINKSWLRNLILSNFIQIEYDNTSYFRIHFLYKLGEVENNNLHDTEYIKDIFNNYCHNMCIFQHTPIYCTNVVKENRVLKLTFIHYGNHKEAEEKEVDTYDEDFY